MPVRAELEWTTDLNAAAALPDLLVIGRKAWLRAPQLVSALGLPEDVWAAMLDRAEPGDAGSAATTWLPGRRIIAGVLPEVCSRHNSPSRAWAIPELARKADGKAPLGIVLALSEDEHAFASALAVARGFPEFYAVSSAVDQRQVKVVALGPGGVVVEPRAGAAMAAVRYAARLADTPTSVLHSDALVDEARVVAAELGCGLTVIQGQELRDQGFGGLWGVGKAASHPPALVALTHEPHGYERTVAWVGKGIVFDTGGLSIKDRGGMVGMKGDMAGAAAVLAAFRAAVLGGFPQRLVAVLCVAENSVGPDSTRPDDILTLKSGRTVEINNTDAEGRLVLGDGVAWVAQTWRPDVIVDMATLTGAQLVATGKVHAGVYTNNEELERAAVQAGRRAGEPVHPLVYAPELHRREFKSNVADMRNSVKDRANAQSSCAAQFIASHLPDPAPPWLHVDIAGPSGDADGRATGYGVGLLLELGAIPL